MKHLIAAAMIALCVCSCKKETNTPVKFNLNSGKLFIQMVKTQLKDSLAFSDYTSLDTNRFFKSKDAQSKGYFVRIALLNKNIATDFILLKTDSLGTIRMGKMVHVEKENLDKNNTKFQGRFTIASLDKKNTILKTILNGRFKSAHNTTDLMEADPTVDE